jgi:hypothetical protein
MALHRWRVAGRPHGAKSADEGTTTVLVTQNAVNPSLTGPISSFVTDSLPTLLQPTPGTMATHALQVGYTLPEAPVDGSVKLTFQAGEESHETRPQQRKISRGYPQLQLRPNCAGRRWCIRPLLPAS